MTRQLLGWEEVPRLAVRSERMVCNTRVHNVCTEVCSHPK